MTPNFDIELADPHLDEPCPCCGGLTVRGTGFVHVRDSAYGVYYLAYSNTHPDQELALIVSVGESGCWYASDDDADTSGRVAFYCRLRPDADSGSYALGLGDAGECRWGDVALLGRMLSRAQALAHPLNAEVFALTDEIGAHDPRVRGYFRRAAAGDTGVPLEHSWRLPHEVAQLDAATREHTCTVGQNFVRYAPVAGGSKQVRFFVRALLTFEVQGYGSWAHGTWVEVDGATYQAAYDAWDDPAAYARLAFEGTLANDMYSGGYPHAPQACTGVRVDVAAPNADQALRVVKADEPGLQRQLSERWPKAEFERWAVERGLL